MGRRPAGRPAGARLVAGPRPRGPGAPELDPEAKLPAARLAANVRILAAMAANVTAAAGSLFQQAAASSDIGVGLGGAGFLLVSCRLASVAQRPLHKPRPNCAPASVRARPALPSPPRRQVYYLGVLAVLEEVGAITRGGWIPASPAEQRAHLHGHAVRAGA
jgi:hypothetical protein